MVSTEQVEIGAEICPQSLPLSLLQKGCKITNFEISHPWLHEQTSSEKYLGGAYHGTQGSRDINFIHSYILISLYDIRKPGVNQSSVKGLKHVFLTGIYCAALTMNQMRLVIGHWWIVFCSI